MDHLDHHFNLSAQLLLDRIKYLPYPEGIPGNSGADRESILTERIISLETSDVLIVANRRIKDYIGELNKRSYSKKEIEEMSDTYRNKLIQFISARIKRIKVSPG
jgi:hypothetical protein